MAFHCKLWYEYVTWSCEWAVSVLTILSLVDESGNLHEENARLATLLSSEVLFQIYCCFKWLNTCCLLDLQRQLTNYESILRNEANSTDDASFRETISSSAATLDKYNQLLDQQNRLFSYDNPDWMCLCALRLFIYRREEMKKSATYSWALRDDDLLVLDPGPPETFLAYFLDLLLSIWPKRLWPSFLVSRKVPRCPGQFAKDLFSLLTLWTEKSLWEVNILAQIDSPFWSRAQV